jgi:RNA polymerase-binding protein DksA
MIPQEVEPFHQQLEQMVGRLSGNVSQLQAEALRTAGGDASGNLSNVPIHLADLASDQYEQEYTIGLLENQELLLEEVIEALNRITRGTFGYCESCGQDIGHERLEAIPYARYCIGCADTIQRTDGTLPGKDQV